MGTRRGHSRRFGAESFGGHLRHYGERLLGGSRRRAPCETAPEKPYCQKVADCVAFGRIGVVCCNGGYGAVAFGGQHRSGGKIRLHCGNSRFDDCAVGV